MKKMTEAAIVNSEYFREDTSNSKASRRYCARKMSLSLRIVRLLRVWKNENDVVLRKSNWIWSNILLYMLRICCSV